MSLHFVTSAQAEDHVSSSDEARKTEGMIGTGGFVLGTKDKLSASMIDANTLRILEGDLIFCGRQVNITNYEEVTIQNGTPGLNSIALVVLNLKTDPSEIATIKVYEGTETDGDPVMPEYIEGDLNNGDTEAEMPLYAITKTGLSVGDPVAQFDVWVSEKEFRTSIGQGFKYTAINDNFALLTKGHLAIIRVYNLHIDALAASTTSWRATLPEGVVPQMYMTSALLSSGSKARVSVNTNRHIEISTSNEPISNATLNGQVVFTIV